MNTTKILHLTVTQPIKVSKDVFLDSFCVAKFVYIVKEFRRINVFY